jgi:hypothetical protein
MREFLVLLLILVHFVTIIGLLVFVLIHITRVVHILVHQNTYKFSTNGRFFKKKECLFKLIKNIRVFGLYVQSRSLGRSLVLGYWGWNCLAYHIELLSLLAWIRVSNCP